MKYSLDLWNGHFTVFSLIKTLYFLVCNEHIESSIQSMNEHYIIKGLLFFVENVMKRFLRHINIHYKHTRWLTFVYCHFPSSLLHRWISGCSDCPKRNDTGLFLLLQLPLCYDSDGETCRPEAWMYPVWRPQDVETCLNFFIWYQHNKAKLCFSWCNLWWQQY